MQKVKLSAKLGTINGWPGQRNRARSRHWRTSRNWTFNTLAENAVFDPERSLKSFACANFGSLWLALSERLGGEYGDRTRPYTRYERPLRLVQLVAEENRLAKFIGKACEVREDAQQLVDGVFQESVTWPISSACARHSSSLNAIAFAPSQLVGGRRSPRSSS